MKIKRVFSRDNGKVKTLFTWQHSGDFVELELDYDASAVFSESMQLIFVEAFEKNKIFSFDLRGILKDSYDIPIKDGYKFRGLNKNNKSSSGISLLYHPYRDDKGNEWNDTEQYEFILKDDILGPFLDIYR